MPTHSRQDTVSLFSKWIVDVLEETQVVVKVLHHSGVTEAL